nr:NAD-dependent epimerase/dehydratase family protein [Cochlodiniinecator piscidefendens]
MIRIGLVGAGYIADWHADAIRMTDGASVAAICDPALGAAQALAAKHGAPTFSSLEDLIQSGTCDAVHILTQPPLHKPLAIEALQGGLHVLVEKPVALSASDVTEINQAAAAADRCFSAGHNFMGTPGYQRLKAAKDAGDIGRITSAEFNWHFPLAPLRSGPFGLWLLQDTKNLLLELGPHLFGFAVDLFGPLNIEHLSIGKPITLPGGAERPQSWRVIARAGDVDITINLSLVETMDDRSVTVRGSTGIARLDYASDTLTINAENSSDIVMNPLRRQLSLTGQDLREGIVNAARQTVSLNRKSAYALSFQGMVKSVSESLRHGRPIDPRFSGESAQTVMHAIDDTLAFLPKQPDPVHTQSRAPNPSVLVIGGTGFIGKRLTEMLVERGHDVRVLSRGRKGPFEHLTDRVEIMQASLKDRAALVQAMQGCDAVYHLGKALEDTWEACLENDVGVTINVAEAAIEAGVKQFVYTGTIASYDMSDPAHHITENTGFSQDMTDRNLYARSKAKCEEELLKMHRDRGLPLVIARPGIVVGQGGPLQHWGIGRWHGAGAVRIWGPGKNTLPFVLIDDVAEGLIRMIEVPEAIGQSFNLIGEPMLTARDYFNAIHNTLGARIKVSPGSLHVFFAADTVKHLLKKYALRRTGLDRASLKDWKSRAHFSPFDNQLPKKVLGWAPEPDRRKFIDAAIVDANLLGF